MSKHLSIGGWRVGIAVLPDTQSGRKLMKALEVIASETWSSVVAPVQLAAQVAYANDDDIEAYISACTAIHGLRTRFIFAGLKALGVQCTEPEGAFYLTVNFDHWRSHLAAMGIRTSPQLASYLLNKHDLATLSCDAFGVDSGQMSLRLASSYLDMEQESDSQRLISLIESGGGEEKIMSRQHHPNVHAALDEFPLFVQKISVQSSGRV